MPFHHNVLCSIDLNFYFFEVKAKKKIKMFYAQKGKKENEYDYKICTKEIGLLYIVLLSE